MPLVQYGHTTRKTRIKSKREPREVHSQPRNKEDPRSRETLIDPETNCYRKNVCNSSNLRCERKGGGDGQGRRRGMRPVISAKYAGADEPDGVLSCKIKLCRGDWTLRAAEMRSRRAKAGGGALRRSWMAVNFGHSKNINDKRSEIKIYKCCGHCGVARRTGGVRPDGDETKETQRIAKVIVKERLMGIDLDGRTCRTRREENTMEIQLHGATAHPRPAPSEEVVRELSMGRYYAACRPRVHSSCGQLRPAERTYGAFKMKRHCERSSSMDGVKSGVRADEDERRRLRQKNLRLEKAARRSLEPEERCMAAKKLKVLRDRSRHVAHTKDKIVKPPLDGFKRADYKDKLGVHECPFRTRPAHPRAPRSSTLAPLAPLVPLANEVTEARRAARSLNSFSFSLCECLMPLTRVNELGDADELEDADVEGQPRLRPSANELELESECGGGKDALPAPWTKGAGTELGLAGPGLDADADKDVPPGTKDVGTGTEGALALESENMAEGESAEGGGDKVKEGETGEYACGFAAPRGALARSHLNFHSHQSPSSYPYAHPSDSYPSRDTSTAHRWRSSWATTYMRRSTVETVKGVGRVGVGVGIRISGYCRSGSSRSGSGGRVRPLINTTRPRPVPRRRSSPNVCVCDRAWRRGGSGSGAGSVGDIGVAGVIFSAGFGCGQSRWQRRGARGRGRACPRRGVDIALAPARDKVLLARGAVAPIALCVLPARL
ncbi:hypothetical protein B0H14DRAFT_2638602 [Mycena olivaceomarginata]|nr:hypothetical protein B0H14DRAFT_2638602 [Mycena olivaceomarginata]